MTVSPNMHARDSSGRQVSLLNDDQPRPEAAFFPRASEHSADRQSNMVRSGSTHSDPSSPLTLGLSRADSYDSYINDPLSPITPISMPEFGRHVSYGSAHFMAQPHYDYHERRSSYDDYPMKPQYTMPVRPQYPNSRSTSHREQEAHEEECQNGVERGPNQHKRYPCRFRESHGCERTFTTSGHASRHSRIHTAEKAVGCVHPGCQKKFTRADNMKQHLETHNKERTRSSSHNKSAGVKKGTSPARPSSRPSSRPANATTTESVSIPLDPALFPQYADFSASQPTITSTRFNLISSASYQGSTNPMVSRRENSQSGLDALASAAAAAAVTCI